MPVAVSDSFTQDAEASCEVKDVSLSRPSESITTSGSSSVSSSRRSSCRSTNSDNMVNSSLSNHHQSSSPDSSPTQSFFEGPDDSKELPLCFDIGENDKYAIDEDIDWEFWSKVISDYEKVTKSEPEELSLHVRRGVPSQLRGMIWQLFVKSKDTPLEEEYMRLLKEESVYEKAIDRDLERRPEILGEYRDRLFHVLKAYSLYDKSVGYHKELLLVTIPLVMNMPDEEAFCVLVRLMHHYDLRGHYVKASVLLQRRLYQFDGILRDQLPHIYKHLDECSVHAGDYASQWFTKLLVHLFPLSIVQRMWDVILADGIKAIHRFAVFVMKANQSEILSRRSKDELLPYLRIDMLQMQQDEVNSMIIGMSLINIEQKRLDQLEKEHHTELTKSKSDTKAANDLQQQNKELTEQVKQQSDNFKGLQKEHAQVAEQLASTKMTIAQVNDDNDALRQQSADLKRALEKLPAEIEQRTKEELEILRTKNEALVKRNQALEEQVMYMENMVAEIQRKYAASEKERNELRQKMAELRHLVA